MAMYRDRVAPVVVVDDDEDDLFNVRRAAEKAHLANPLVCLHDGEEAMRFLSSFAAGGPGAGPEPVVLILDLKMPRMSGFEVLEWLRLQPGLRRLPVVVFTSSGEDPDIRRAYELGANSYLVKPVAFGNLVEMMSALGLYWLIMNERPALTTE
jgi:CheY-like chemotaxis protein